MVVQRRSSGRHRLGGRSGSASRARRGRGTRSRSRAQAIQPGTISSSHSGAVTRYRPPAHSTVRMRQPKCDSCQVPAASSRLTRSRMKATSSSSTLACTPGSTAPTATIGVQHVADVADGAQRAVAFGVEHRPDVDHVVHVPSSSRGLRLAGGELLQPRQALAPLAVRPARRPASGRSAPARSSSGTTGRPPRTTILLAVAVLAGHHRLGGLLADLLQDRVVALGEQARDVALVRVAAALRDSITAARRASVSSLGRRSFVDVFRVFRAPARRPARRRRRRRWKKQVWRPVWQAMPGSWPSCVDLEQHARRCRSRGAARAPSGSGRTPRPCATAGRASGSSTPPRRARRSAPAPRGS